MESLLLRDRIEDSGPVVGSIYSSGLGFDDAVLNRESLMKLLSPVGCWKRLKFSGGGFCPFAILINRPDVPVVVPALDAACSVCQLSRAMPDSVFLVAVKRNGSGLAVCPGPESCVPCLTEPRVFDLPLS